MSEDCDIAIIGAGPYGLSLAAHLKHLGLSFRIFGKALDSWSNHMPKGMLLKSPGMASSLSAPLDGTRISDYCTQVGETYDDHKHPVRLDLFHDYGKWFQTTQVPSLDQRLVTSLSRCHDGFVLGFAEGEKIAAKRVVVMTGITSFAHMPEPLAPLPREFVSHTFDHRDVSGFAGDRVAVIGAGASAIDLAAELDEAGAEVTIIARSHEIRFHTPPTQHDEKLINQIKYPLTGIGPGWRSFFCANTPLLFKLLPEELRLRAVKNHLGPAPGWFMREKVEGKIPIHKGQDIAKAVLEDGKVYLTLRGTGGADALAAYDHVIAATGYRPDLNRLSFLSTDLQMHIAQVQNTPILSDQFESSVPGLYFAGPVAANSFGPLMRFMVGAEFVAPRLAKHLSRRAGRTLRQAA